MNLLDPIRRYARLYPDRPAVIENGKTMAFRGLWKRTGAMAVNLRAQGIRRGDCVAISGLTFRMRLIVILALARLGAVSTTVAATMPRATRDDLFANNGAVAWVVKDLPADPGAAPRRLDLEQLLQPVADGTVLPYERDLEGEVWRIALSSGTTGNSKCVPWTHGETAKLQRLSLDVYHTGPRERLLIAVDLNIGFALGHTMQQLAAGGTVLFPHALEPAELLQLIRTAQPTRMLTTPANAAAFIAKAKAKDGGAEGVGSSLLSIMLGGSALVPKLRADIESLLCPNIVVVYGSTEMGSTARLDLSTFMEFPQSTGRVMPWIQAMAIGDNEEPLPPGETGRLRFRAPAMASRYIGHPEATAAAFRDGWYYPGDTGSIDANGVLTLGGRSDDLLNLDGAKLDPVDIEAVLNAHPAVAECAATVLHQGDQQARLVILVVQSTPGEAFDDAALRAVLAGHIGAIHVRARFFAVPQLPRTPAGKLARKQLPALAFEAARPSAPTQP